MPSIIIKSFIAKNNLKLYDSIQFEDNNFEPKN